MAVVTISLRSSPLDVAFHAESNTKI